MVDDYDQHEPHNLPDMVNDLINEGHRLADGIPMYARVMPGVADGVKFQMKVLEVLHLIAEQVERRRD